MSVAQSRVRRDADDGPAVRSEVIDGVRHIIFWRPDKLNALTTAELNEVTRLVTDPGEMTRALVFTGAGDRAFSAGMHVDSFLGLSPADARRFIGQVRDFVGAVRTSPLPTAAMINGYCLGAAFELALACDLRVSVDTARFGLPEVKVGIPSVVDAALLQQHVGLSMAKEIILTGDLYGADDMYRLGMLNRVVAADRLSDETLALLSRVTRHTVTVLAGQKRLFETWQNTALAVGIEASVEEFGRVFEHPETQQQIQRYRTGLRRSR
jgi:enoyl-CoA hydratase/carnithine racemase